MRFSLWALPSLSQCSSSPPIHYISSGRSAWSNLDLIWCVCARVCVCEYDCENRRGERKKGEAKSQNLTQQSGSFGRYSFTLQYYCKTSWSFKSHKNITMALQICTSRSNSFSFWHTAALGLNARDVQRIPWLLKKNNKNMFVYKWTGQMHERGLQRTPTEYMLKDQWGPACNDIVDSDIARVSCKPVSAMHS